MDGLRQWDVVYRPWGLTAHEVFRCWADCGIDAVDQCRDAEPKAAIIRADLTGGGQR